MSLEPRARAAPDPADLGETHRLVLADCHASAARMHDAGATLPRAGLLLLIGRGETAIAARAKTPALDILRVDPRSDDGAARWRDWLASLQQTAPRA